MVNKDRVQLLVEALRSGQYQQGMEFLHKNNDGGQDQFCCLGVACDVAVKNGLDVSVEPVEDKPNFITYDENGGYMPTSVYHWYGFTTDDPVIDRNDQNGQVITATKANDNMRWTFGAIANAIEKTYLNDGE